MSIDLESCANFIKKNSFYMSHTSDMWSNKTFITLRREV